MHGKSRNSCLYPKRNKTEIYHGVFAVPITTLSEEIHLSKALAINAQLALRQLRFSPHNRLQIHESALRYRVQNVCRTPHRSAPVGRAAIKQFCDIFIRLRQISPTYFFYPVVQPWVTPTRIIPVVIALFRV